MGRRVGGAGAVGLVLAVAAVASACSGEGGSVLRVSGSTSVNPIVAEAAEELRARGIRITVDTQGGSGGGITQLGQGQIDVAMSSKPLTPEDRRRFGGTDFVETVVGIDAIAVAVRREVFEGGVTNLSRDQARALFEGRVVNWSELGGPDLGVFVYDKEPGRGTREVFETYLYGADGSGTDPPPPPGTDRYAIVGGNEEGRTKASSTPGAVTIISAAFLTEGGDLVAVSLDGIGPDRDEIASGRYPLARSLLLLTDGPPSGAAATLVELLTSAQGRAIVSRLGFLTPAELGTG